MAELKYTVELTDEVQKKINEMVQAATIKSLEGLSGNITRLNSLVGQIEGDVTAMVARMQEARSIVAAINATIEEMSDIPEA